ncbi:MULTISPECIES: phosphodiesterase [Clostridium]|uniref:Phosphoesterase n=1 Tax=Clostridium cadaveris TaxID=1529 RepID=A0A1I2M4U9_9CLOT|nr:phosphodiesterase [Clostridium cadaveris]MDU4953281.1 phosphodiesterase [Clostridium sp.]MDM8311462.1 phosphodiesterase [Clostridium cadaveris]NME65543.1 phosphodiesterase [Clostridium cadaveris]NWK10166.1 phosphodiesterase [Clostridium cadaveris]PWL51599.1 MAG: phosphodiesterase [Clostridium cadaveris]
MKIAILSDIHGYPEKFSKALEYFSGCDMILCAGDILYHGPRNPILDGYNPKALVEEIKKCPIPILISRGNCDAEVDLMVLDLPLISEYIVYEKDGTRFIMTHGHNQDGCDLEKIASTYNADVIITGHTHVRKCLTKDGVTYINPGSISVPKGDGIPSVCIYENGKSTFIDISTGKKL